MSPRSWIALPIAVLLSALASDALRATGESTAHLQFPNAARPTDAIVLQIMARADAIQPAYIKAIKRYDRDDGMRFYVVTLDLSSVPGARIMEFSTLLQVGTSDSQDKIDEALGDMVSYVLRAVENVKSGREWNAGLRTIRAP